MSAAPMEYVQHGLSPCECGDVAGSRVGKGIHLGYPGCCIEFYLERSTLYDLGIPVADGQWKLDGSGFIPCPSHNQISEDVLVGLIQAARQCPLPFSPNPPIEIIGELPPCDCYPHGPQEPCTCNGCHYCTGHKHGCTCDINWACTEHDPCPQRAANQRLTAMADRIHDGIYDEEADNA